MSQNNNTNAARISFLENRIDAITAAHVEAVDRVTARFDKAMAQWNAAVLTRDCGAAILVAPRPTMREDEMAKINELEAAFQATIAPLDAELCSLLGI